MSVPQIVYESQKVKVIDNVKTARVAMKYRADAGLSLSAVHEQMRDDGCKISLPMVHYMERGKRRWTAQAFDAFITAVDKLRKPVAA